MNQSIKEKWVAALRSGKYQQGAGYLRRDDKFCCLGVLCDVLGKRWYTEVDGSWSVRRGGVVNSGVLPYPLREELKIEYGAMNGLAKMNDRGKSFKVIANWIEKNL